jgi:AraC-like DNA-binding protein/quercetin dioxygenase-like cupin family protein
MNRVAVLLATPAVTLQEFDHPPGDEHLDPDHESSPQDSISFVEEGVFHAHVDDEHWELAAGSIFITRRGMTFSCRHVDEVPNDRCLTVTYSDAAVEDLMRADLPALRAPFARLSARRQYLRHRLRSCGAGDHIRLDLLAGALFESLAANRPSAPASLGGNVTPLMRRIDRAVQLIETSYARELTLGDLASTAGLSPFYFARVFQRFVGVPPHRYLTGVRLRHAARMLDDGAAVTFTCYEVGFGSLSHFITAFRKRFGVVPSAARRGSPVPALRAGLSLPSFAGR